MDMRIIEPLLNGCLSVAFSATALGRIYFVIVRNMCKRWQHSCMETVLPPPPTQVWIITVWTSACENVDIKNGCVENNRT